MTEKYILSEGQHFFGSESSTSWNNTTLDDAGAIAMLKLDIGHLARFISYPKDGQGNVILDGQEAAPEPEVFNYTVTDPPQEPLHEENNDQRPPE